MANKMTDEVKEFARKVISLIEEGKGFSPFLISNKRIYHEVTGLSRFSRKRWEKIAPLIRAINYFKEGNKELHSYAPMLGSRYNVKATEAERDWRYICGFQLVIREVEG